MVKPVIFLGPSLSIEKARDILDADYRLPAKKGDLLKLILRDVDIVGLIDGYFLQDYPPTPIEVYNLLRKKNVKVFGSSSLGALRAVELGKYGMIGIGKIFTLFRDGILNSDDEVAVTFTENSNYKSEALIDIRYNLFLAQKDKYIDQKTKKAILKVSRNIYFPYRTYDDILDKCKMKYPDYSAQFDKFREFILLYRKSLKEIDAILLLKHIKNLIELKNI